jgi:hypothetical protein
MQFESKDLGFSGITVDVNDRQKASEGVAALAMKWRQQLEEMLVGSEPFAGIVAYEQDIQEARTELTALQGQQQDLDREHNRQLAERAPVNVLQKIEQRLADLTRKLDVVSGRIRKLETLRDSEYTSAALELADGFDHLRTVLTQESTTALAELEATICRELKPRWLEYLAARSLLVMRGHQLEAFRRRLSEGQARTIIGEILAKRRTAAEPAAELLEAGTE